MQCYITHEKLLPRAAIVSRMRISNRKLIRLKKQISHCLVKINRATSSGRPYSNGINMRPAEFCKTCPVENFKPTMHALFKHGD